MSSWRGYSEILDFEVSRAFGESMTLYPRRISSGGVDCIGSFEADPDRAEQCIVGTIYQDVCEAAEFSNGVRHEGYKLCIDVFGCSCEIKKGDRIVIFGTGKAYEVKNAALEDDGNLLRLEVAKTA